MPAGEVGEALDVPGATLSFHLKELRNAGIVKRDRRGRSLVYSAHFETMAAIVRYLTENCCGGECWVSLPDQPQEPTR